MKRVSIRSVRPERVWQREWCGTSARSFGIKTEGYQRYKATIQSAEKSAVKVKTLKFERWQQMREKRRVLAVTLFFRTCHKTPRGMLPARKQYFDEIPHNST